MPEYEEFDPDFPSDTHSEDEIEELIKEAIPDPKVRKNLEYQSRFHSWIR